MALVVVGACPLLMQPPIKGSEQEAPSALAPAPAPFVSQANAYGAYMGDAAEDPRAEEPRAEEPAYKHNASDAHAYAYSHSSAAAAAPAYASPPAASAEIPIYANPLPSASAYPPAYPSAPAQSQAPAAGSAWTGGYGASGAYNSSANAPSRPVVQSQTEVLTPIQGLNPYNNRWSIKARISSKSDIKTWKKPGSEGSLFSIDLVDSTKGEIRGTFFKKACDDWYPKLKQGSVYIFSGGKVKPVANRAFSNLKNDYEITFDEKCTIKEAEDDAAISQQTFHFVKISDIVNKDPNTTIDVIAIVKSAGDVAKLTSQKQGGKELTKRDLTLVDDTNTEIRLTLWGAQASSQEHDWSLKPIVAFKGVKVGDYNGRTLSLAGSMQVAPNIPEGTALFNWMRTNGGDVSAIKTGSLSNSGGSSGANKDTFESRKKCLAIKEENLGTSEKADWVTMKLSLTYVKTDNDPWYTACSTPDCKKKLTEAVGDGKWHCEKCRRPMDSCVRRYILSTQMCDYSGTEWFSFFDEQAKTLFGVSADELLKKRDQGMDLYHAITRKPILRQFIVKAKVKSEEMQGGAGQGGTRVKCSVVSIEPVNYRTECVKMIDAINKYGAV